MNTQNETIISPEMMKALREAGVDRDYQPVPPELQAKAMRLLGHNPMADMDADMKRKLRNIHKRMRRQGVAGY